MREMVRLEYMEKIPKLLRSVGKLIDKRIKEGTIRITLADVIRFAKVEAELNPSRRRVEITWV